MLRIYYQFQMNKMGNVTVDVQPSISIIINFKYFMNFLL